MTFAIAPTDQDWFDTLERESLGVIVNFWTPNPWNIKGLVAGDLLYFMLKSPIRKIGGYGHFVEYQNMTASQSWKQYGMANGVYDLQELVDRTQAFAKKNSQSFSPSRDPVIGCIILSDPVVFEEQDYFEPSDYGFDFPKQVVKLKYYHDAKEIPHHQSSLNSSEAFELVSPEEGKKRRVPVKDRVGQPAFRRTVLRAYNNRCAVTRTKVVEVLQAAHIQPYTNERSNHITNGICLRADLHKLFDEGLITISDDYSIVASTRLTKVSKAYGNLHGREIRLPKNINDRPSILALRYHHSNIFIGR